MLGPIKKVVFLNRKAIGILSYREIIPGNKELEMKMAGELLNCDRCLGSGWVLVIDKELPAGSQGGLTHYVCPACHGVGMIGNIKEIVDRSDFGAGL